MTSSSPPIKGRGATFNPANRFRREEREAVDDGWESGATPQDEEAGPEDDLPPRLKTVVTIQPARTIIAHNDSPDVGFSQSINPYQGCEHGCIYCYARPSHAYLDLSPGLDFESKLFAKPNAVELLRAELSKPGYVCDPIALGSNTDPYQPIEREWRITRQIIELLGACNHPITITTKGVLVERDLDLLAPMAARNLVRVGVSLAVLDRDLARKMDPRAPAPERRLLMIERLAKVGIPVTVMVAPIIPQLNDKSLEAILEAAAQRGASGAAWIMLRLPHELSPLFREWLETHFRLRAQHIMSVLQQIRGGRDNDPRFGERMRGSGAFVDLIEQRFDIAVKRLGLNGERAPLDVTQFVPPTAPSRARKPGSDAQLKLF
jgi:DNA repair photolyase